MHHHNVNGVVAVHLGWFKFDWFVPTQEEIDDGFPCTVEQMKEMTEGFQDGEYKRFESESEAWPGDSVEGPKESTSTSERETRAVSSFGDARHHGTRRCTSNTP